MLDAYCLGAGCCCRLAPVADWLPISVAHLRFIALLRELLCDGEPPSLYSVDLLRSLICLGAEITSERWFPANVGSYARTCSLSFGVRRVRPGAIRASLLSAQVQRGRHRQPSPPRGREGISASVPAA